MIRYLLRQGSLVRPRDDKSRPRDDKSRPRDDKSRPRDDIRQALDDKLSRLGFTLVELIVVVTITMVISAGLLVNYSTYNDNQRVRQAALTLKNNLRLAQTKAMSGAKPRGVACTTLRGYITTFQSATYDSQALCTEGAVGEKASYTLPASVRFTMTSPVTFAVLSGSISSPTTLTMRGVSKTYSVNISASGEMTLTEGE